MLVLFVALGTVKTIFIEELQLVTFDLYIWEGGVSSVSDLEKWLAFNWRFIWSTFLRELLLTKTYATALRSVTVITILLLLIPKRNDWFTRVPT